MAASLSTVSGKDGSGTLISGGVQALDLSGAGTGPWSFAYVVVDGAAGSTRMAVKAASTAPLTTDTAAVVAISPNLGIDHGAGTGGSSTIRTLIDSSQLSVLQTAAQAMATGYQLVALPTDQAAVSIKSGATGSAVPSTSVYNSGNASTALATAATAGNLTGAMFDKFGRQVMLPVTVRDLVGRQATTISASTSGTTIVTAGGANIFTDLLCLLVSNTSASTNTRVDISDGTFTFSLESIAGAPPVGIPYMGTPIPATTANTAWTATCATSTTDIRVVAFFANNK